MNDFSHSRVTVVKPCGITRGAIPRASRARIRGRHLRNLVLNTGPAISRFGRAQSVCRNARRAWTRWSCSLLTAFLTPLVAALRAESSRLSLWATGAYVVFVVHAGVDWDWEMSALTMTGVGCGFGLLIAAQGTAFYVGYSPPALRNCRCCCCHRSVLLVGLMGNVPASKAQNAIGDRNWHRANSEARKEIRWAPWSADGWRRLGQSGGWNE